MARRRSGSDRLRVSVEGLEQASRIPGWLEEGQRVTLEEGGKRIGKDLADAAPGGDQGSVGRSIRVRTITSTRLVIEVNHRAAKALTGSSRRASGPGKALRFEAGGETRFVRYPRRTIIPRNDWPKKGLRRRKSRIQQAYDDAFRDLEVTAARH